VSSPPPAEGIPAHPCVANERDQSLSFDRRNRAVGGDVAQAVVAEVRLAECAWSWPETARPPRVLAPCTGLVPDASSDVSRTSTDVDIKDAVDAPGRINTEPPVGWGPKGRWFKSSRPDCSDSYVPRVPIVPKGRCRPPYPGLL
jgi:hypothetical protein